MSGGPGGLAPSGPAEEWIDARLHRPLAAWIVRPLVATSITPNQVTGLACTLGVAAGVMVFAAAERPRLLLVAAAILFAAVVFDCVDGQLARARGTSSRTGDMLDGLGDLAVNLTVLAATTYTVANHWGPRLWLLGAFAMVSYGLQCSLFDFAKRTYLSRSGARPLPTTADFHRLAELEGQTRQSRQPGEAFLLWFYRHYLGSQQSVSGMLAGFHPDALTLARMRAWTWLGLGTHLAVLYVALAVAAFWPPALVAALVLFCTAGNALLAALLRSA